MLPSRAKSVHSRRLLTVMVAEPAICVVTSRPPSCSQALLCCKLLLAILFYGPRQRGKHQISNWCFQAACTLWTELANRWSNAVCYPSLMYWSSDEAQHDVWNWWNVSSRRYRSKTCYPYPWNNASHNPHASSEPAQARCGFSHPCQSLCHALHLVVLTRWCSHSLRHHWSWKGDNW